MLAQANFKRFIIVSYCKILVAWPAGEDGLSTGEVSEEKGTKLQDWFCHIKNIEAYSTDSLIGLEEGS